MFTQLEVKMKIILTLLLATLFMGCSDEDESRLHGKWVFEYWEEQDSGRREYPPTTSSSVSIEFIHKGNISGLGPCNLYSGEYTESIGNRLSVRSLLSTGRARAEDTLNRWEQRYFNSLSQVYSFGNTAKQLKLYAGKPVRALVFRLSE